MNGHIFRRLRVEKGLSQAALAEEVGLTQPAYSLLERGLRSITPRVRRELERRLALGEPTDAEEDPVFVLARLEDDEPIELLFTDDGKIGLYSNRVVAEATASGLLRAVAKEPVHALPAWLPFVASAVIRQIGPHAEEAARRLYFVDYLKNPNEVAIAAGEHAVAVVRAMQSAEGHEIVARDAAALVGKKRPPKARRKQTRR